jgi:hypothetical protein
MRVPDSTICPAGTVPYLCSFGVGSDARKQSPGQRYVRLQWATRSEVSGKRREDGNVETRDRFEAHVRRFLNLANNVRFRETVTSFLRKTHERLRSYGGATLRTTTNARLDASRCLVRILPLRSANFAMIELSAWPYRAVTARSRAAAHRRCGLDGDDASRARIAALYFAPPAA